MTQRPVDRILETLDPPPTLLDIGASGEPPPMWKALAPHATYVGFDPDDREVHGPPASFKRSLMVPEAVTADEAATISFNLTASPYCSSALLPDGGSLDHYLFADLFDVVGTAEAGATRLTEVLQRFDLHGIDWFKSDSQGTDLRLFMSLPDDVRARVLAVDVEPGLIDAYIGEDLFIDAHRTLVGQGFWLADLHVKGSVRIHRRTVAELSVSRRLLSDGANTAPGWCEARYFRSVELVGDRRSHLLLWVFAVIDLQLGFALDVSRAYRERFGADETYEAILAESLRLLNRHARLNMLSRPDLLARRVYRRVRPS
jgi:hypothetical protein